MAFPWFTWLTWITVIIQLAFPLVQSTQSSLVTGECLYQECAVNPLAECYFSSDLLIDCETREACQRVIVYKVIPESPLKENLSITLHSYSLRPNTSIDLTLDVSYMIGSHLKSVALQSFKCLYSHENGTSSATMVGYNDSQVLGEVLYTGESIHCQWIISPEGPLWPIQLDGQPLNLYNHVFACNRLSVNSSLVYVFTHAPPLHRLRYITDTLYPNNRLPFNPCELSQSPKKQCSGQTIIVPRHEDETYLEVYLIVFDPISGINLQLKHSADEQNIGLLRCRFDSTLNPRCVGALNNPGDFDDTDVSSSLSIEDYQLGSVEASPLFNSTGLRAFWRVPVSFAQLWNSQGSDGVDFLLDLTITMESGEVHSTRGTIKVNLSADYPSPLDYRKCLNSDSSSTSSLFLSHSNSLIWFFSMMVLAQLLH
uniref:CUB domain-containing protein n=1 Tax=Tetranychus urticae TaxID=32264 RepID=T1KAQ1_TETUR